jgi:hypothetical protein
MNNYSYPANSLDFVHTLYGISDKYQSEASQASSFEELMQSIIISYRAEIASSKIIFKDDPERLKQDVDFWQKSIDDSNAAIEANKQAKLKAQNSNNPESVMEQELSAFIEGYNPNFEIYMQYGDWWADVEY